jgi:putative intracellular protease/amidase
MPLPNGGGRWPEPARQVGTPVASEPADRARLSDGRWLVQDKELTAFSWAEEKADNRDEVVPFNLEEELKARGARYTKAMLPLGKHVVEDGLLITGQNPASARGVGEAVARALRQSAPRAQEHLEAV